MTERKRVPNRASSSADLSAELLSLLNLSKLDVLLRKGLGIAIRVLEAEAGSILFQADPTRRLRAGVFRQETALQVNRWEQAIQQRLRNSVDYSMSDSPSAFTYELASGRLLINQPILRDNKITSGSISLVLPPDHTFNISHRAALSRIAETIGGAGATVARLETMQHRLSQLDILYQLGDAMTTNYDLRTLLHETMERLKDRIGAAASSLYLLDGEVLVLEIAPWARGRSGQKLRTPLDEGVPGWVARHGQMAMVNEPRVDPRFSYQADMRTGFLTQSLLAVPLKTQGRIIGVLELLNKYNQRGFNQQDAQLLRVIAAQFAIIIENNQSLLGKELS